jgi:hypothetical protein
MRLAYDIITAYLQILYASCSSNDRKGAAGRPSCFPELRKFPRLGFTMILSLRWSFAIGIPLVAKRELQLQFPSRIVSRYCATTIVGSDHA